MGENIGPKARMPGRTRRANKRSGRRRHRTRSVKKSGGAPRPEAWTGKLRDINERLRSVLDDAYDIEEVNDGLGDLRFHSLPQETQRALSNAYNTIEDVVQKIKEACDVGTEATGAALSAL